jgi:D-alanine-D-alanine ligase
MTDKKKVAFLTGGYSGEAEISYNSAKQIQANLDYEIFDVYRIDIRKDGWFYQPNNTTDGETAVDKNDFSITINGSKINFDVVLIGIHGTPGEDGRLQGYFDMLGMPYTGCSAAASAITFNKRYTTSVAGNSGIAVAKSQLYFSHDDKASWQQATELTFPLFVKPNNGGSSIGMSRITDATAIHEAFEKAFKEDNQVLVEEFISGREFTVGVYKSNNTLQVLPITEIQTDNVFFDFEAKYKGKSKEITPADIPADVKEKIEAAAKKLYTVFNLNGVVRIDFIYNQATNTPYMLEINTVPGQSEASVIPQQVRATGGSLKDFYTSIILQALKNK